MDEFYYYLGLIAADGYRTRYGVGLDLNDKDIVSKCAKYFKANEPRDYYNKRRVLISNVRLVDITWKYLRTPRKDTMRLPPIPKKYFSHFVRGYFDGDGSASHEYKNGKLIRVRVSIRGPIPFLLDMHKIVNLGQVYTTNKKCGQWYIPRKELTQFTKLIYKDSKIHIGRKYDRLVSATGVVISPSKNRI